SLHLVTPSPKVAAVTTCRYPVYIGMSIRNGVDSRQSTVDSKGFAGSALKPSTVDCKLLTSSMIASPALFRAFPELAARLPWVDLAELPTPIVRLERLGRACGLSDLWVKRDDQTSTHYGGNKVRQLEFLLAAAQRRQAGRVVVLGPVGSHG